MVEVRNVVYLLKYRADCILRNPVKCQVNPFCTFEVIHILVQNNIDGASRVNRQSQFMYFFDLLYFTVTHRQHPNSHSSVSRVFGG